MSDSIVWIIDDDKSIRWVLEKTLKQVDIQVKSFCSANTIIKELEQQQPDTIISDIRMPGIDGLALMKQIKNIYPDLPVIIMTAHSDLESAVSSYEGGAFEYLPKPFDTDEAVELVKRALAFQQRKKPRKSANLLINSPDIIGEAPSMQELFRAIGRLSRSNISVMINGESGTGKELVAKALHRHSPRQDEPFIALNMAAIAKDLLESELFGHEKGAFTGAQNQRIGRFEQADGGTLFLDEIGDMPADLQTRLLRVLSDGEFYRVGGHTPIKVDVRIIAATHQNLDKLVNDGLFREDLFHRLNVIRIRVPALRERQEDIPLLAGHFLHLAAQELSVEVKTLDEESKNFLREQYWSGNVRQLENTCRWLTVMSPAEIIHLDDMPEELKVSSDDNESQVVNDWRQGLNKWLDSQLLQGKDNILETLMPEFEKIIINSALRYTHGRKQEAAKLLGWGRNTLTRKINELNIV
ncbi:MAG: nitrogen regulation protein NR(I) [Gammaproteobacteria bacterium]|nr:nitrogen regulation protein NR(I) [Gammaproteobacteria bacterium]